MFAPCISMLIGKHVVTMTAMFLHTLHEESLRGKLQTCAKWNYPICYVFHVCNRHWQKRNFCQQIMPIQTWNCTCHRNNHWSFANDFFEVEWIAAVNFQTHVLSLQHWKCTFNPTDFNESADMFKWLVQQMEFEFVHGATVGKQFVHGAMVDMQHSRQRLIYIVCVLSHVFRSQITTKHRKHGAGHVQTKDIFFSDAASRQWTFKR